MRLNNRKVVVVGAGTRPSDDPDAPVGNGRAIAVACAREGARVAVVDWDRAAAEETAAMIGDDAMGGIDGLVLNVGIAAGSRLAGTTVWSK